MIKSISKSLEKAAQSVGVLTSLTAISVFGFSALLINAKAAVYATIAAFGLVGALEVHHRQAKAELDKRRQATDVNALFDRAISSKKTTGWHPKMFKEFTHCGVRLRAIGFEEMPGPIGVSVPICPACEGRLVETAKVLFPGRIRIWFTCPCGYKIRSQFTEAELMKQAASIGGLPV